MVVKVPTAVYNYMIYAKEMEPEPIKASIPIQPEKVDIGLGQNDQGLFLYVVGTDQMIGNLKALSATQDSQHLEVTCELYILDGIKYVP